MNQNPFRFWKTIRLYFRLISSYVQANRAFFIFGVAVSILLAIFPPHLAPLFSSNRPLTIGLSGNYTISSLPAEVQNIVSIGLTKLQPDGQATASAAVSWDATDSGKRVTFTLRSDLKWQDGQPFDARQVNYNLKSVEMTRPDNTHVTFLFKEPFAPLLVTLSQPLFKNGLVGLGRFQVKSVKFNGRFVSQIELYNPQTKKSLVYKFYPRESDLLTALKLGAIDKAVGLHQISGLNDSQHYSIESQVEPATIATLFYNTQSVPFEEKSIRQALTYALPDSFPGLDKADAPAPKDSWFTSDTIKKYHQDMANARRLWDKTASQSAAIKIIINTNKSLEPVANQIKSSWAQIGVDVKVEVSEIIPETYQVYLTYLELPADPDQYALWHSTQTGNISHLKNPKIDKLLEEGRRTIDLNARKEIYSSLQKAITEELPAAFLYYSQAYTVSRK